MSPLTLCLAASVCFDLSPMKPRLGLIVLVPAAPGHSRGRPNETAKKRYGGLGICTVRPDTPSGLRRRGSASDRETPLITGVNGTLMARPWDG